jgi:uncharacterized membrane protein
MAIAIFTLLIAYNHLVLPKLFMITWIAYSLSNLILSWFSILSSHPREILKTAALQDASRTFIFIFLVIIASVSLFVVILLLKSTQNLIGQELIIYVLLNFLSVISSWWSVHTVFSFRYAHLYYGSLKNHISGKDTFGGLLFPNDSEPDYLDFVYFSFIIGMTFQVSDVIITSKHMRRLVWIHSIISFVFNTVILALSINIISSLIK